MAQATNVKIVRDPDATRGLVATWSWDNSYTDHYWTRWWYTTTLGIPFLQEENQNASVAMKYSRFTIPDDAVRVWFHVKPVARTHTVNNQEVPYFTADWSTQVTWYDTMDLPSTPSAPSVTIKDYTLTATIDNIPDNVGIVQFQLFKDNTPGPSTTEVNVSTRHASASWTISPGGEYKVRARYIRIYDNQRLFGEWSDYSSNSYTKPGTPSGITVCRASSKSSIYLEWTAVTSAESYDIQYATKKSYLESSNAASSVTGIESTYYEMTGLESGNEYFFRVRAVNSQGQSSWSGIKSAILGKNPSAPTTWSSTTTAVVGEGVTLYWVHNSEDGSKQTHAEVEITVDGNTQTYTVTTSTDDDEDEKTNSYPLDTSKYTDGVTIKWRVRTAGVTNTYGEWSVLRTITIYAPPTLMISVTDKNAQAIERLTSFPFYISGSAGPDTQTPLGYHVSIVSSDSYETLDYMGNTVSVKAGETVYSKTFDTSEQLLVEMSANNIDLQNNVSYTVTCVVTMDSGLTAEATAEFTVAWQDEFLTVDAEIGVNTDTYEAYIRPYCIDENGALIEGVILSVYRREFDGSFTEIISNVSNTDNTFVTDPHPALDYARYRIVAITESTGAVSYYDAPGYPIGCPYIIIQWDEIWNSFDIADDGTASDDPWAGSMLKLPGNIDISDKNSSDVSMIEYIGRKHPVSYYGTQLGVTSTWKTDIPKSDKETLYGLRRLALWMGDCYVREPSGSGYWANVAVSFSQTHLQTVIPVTFEMTRVEGGEP